MLSVHNAGRMYSECSCIPRPSRGFRSSAIVDYMQYSTVQCSVVHSVAMYTVARGFCRIPATL